LDVTNPMSPTQVKTYPNAPTGQDSNKGCRLFQAGRNAATTPAGKGGRVSSQSAAAVERNGAGGAGHPALAALTALCRGDAAVADLIRAVAASLESERLVLNDPGVESVA